MPCCAVLCCAVLCCVPLRVQNQQEATEADRRFAQAGYRLNLRARLLLIRSYVALNTVLNRALLATLYAFGQPVAMY